MKLTIIGASGHGKVVAEIASLCGYDKIEFLDDKESLNSCGSYPVVGKVDRAMETDNDIFFAIGNGTVRKKLMDKLRGKSFPILIHPSATVSNEARIGSGTVVMAGAVINPGVTIGKGCIINTCASVDHDCVIGDHVHISVGAHLAGTVSVGDMTWIGAGATVSNNLSICGDCMIGAGAVVVKNIEEKGTYIGVPAKMIDKDKTISGGGYWLTRSRYSSKLSGRRVA